MRTVTGNSNRTYTVGEAGPERIVDQRRVLWRCGFWLPFFPLVRVTILVRR